MGALLLCGPALPLSHTQDVTTFLMVPVCVCTLLHTHQCVHIYFLSYPHLQDPGVLGSTHSRGQHITVWFMLLSIRAFYCLSSQVFADLTLAMTEWAFW